MKLKLRQYQTKLSISFEHFVFFQSQTSITIKPDLKSNLGGMQTWQWIPIYVHFLIRRLSNGDSSAMFDWRVPGPDFVVRWHWNVGDLVIWDNRCTMHCATGRGVMEGGTWICGDWVTLRCNDLWLMQKGDSGVFSQYTWAKQDCRPQNRCFEYWFHEDHKQLHACCFFVVSRRI